MLKSPRLVILTLAVLLLPVLLFVASEVDSASAASQKWYLSDVDSDLDDWNQQDIYVMYKGDYDNSTNDYVTITDDAYRLWIADQVVTADEVVFDPDDTCYWGWSFLGKGSDQSITWIVGGYDPSDSSFYDQTDDGDEDNDKLTLQQGDYLAVQLVDDDENSHDVDVQVGVLPGDPFPELPCYLSWSCDSPPYPVPDIGAWIMFSTGAILVGFIAWRCRRKLLYSNALH